MHPHWNIELFGRLIVCREDERITHFATQKTATLLSYLAFYCKHSHSREALIELLWPDCELNTGRTRLSTLLSYVRHLLEPPGTETGTVLQADRRMVRLNPTALTTDVAEFERLLQTASQVEEATKRVDLLQRSVSLYQNGLLPDSYEEWVGREQTRLQNRYTEALQELGLAWEQVGEIETALTMIEQAIQMDPYREATHRTRMRLQAALGRPAAVQESYQSLERLFQEDLGAAPSLATREFLARLRSDPCAAVTVRETLSSAVSLAPASKPPAPDPVILPEITTFAILPLRMSRFFGRTQELEVLQQQLAEHATRLVTIIGAGGTGKTRLAIEAAENVVPTLHNRVWFVPLADLPDAHLLPYALARALKLSVTDTADPLEPVLALLNEAPCLLVLDNFEHLLREETPDSKGDQRLLDKGTALVRLLLERAPPLRCLVTSRCALRLSGEQEFPLASLALPALSASPEEVLRAASVSLYVDRAKQVRPDFAVTANNAYAVAQLCRRLEGIPLAIEMAAAWAKVLTPVKMLERLEARLDALTSRRRDLPLRHQSLRATLDWSYELLTASQQRLLVRLAVFRGGWTLAAAECICVVAETDEMEEKDQSQREEQAFISEWEVLELLTVLTEKSLVVSEEVQGEGRYRLLEMVRQYAQDRLSASEEGVAVQARHYGFFREMAEASWDKTKSSEQILCLNEMEREHDNLRAALAWSGSEAGRQYVSLDAELDLAGRLSPFCFMRGYWREGREQLEKALACETNSLLTEVRARALLGVGIYAANMGDFVAARASYEECLNIQQQLGDTQGIGSVVLALGNMACDEGDFAAAHGWYEQCLELARAREDTSFLAAVLGTLGSLAQDENDVAAQQRYVGESLRLHRQSGDQQGIAIAQQNLSQVFIQQRDFPAAYASLSESLTLLQQVRDKRVIYHALSSLAEAETLQGRTLTAVRLWGAVQRLREETGAAPNRNYQSNLLAAKGNLGNALYEAALAQGCALGVEQAVEQALIIIQGAPWNMHPERINPPP